MFSEHWVKVKRTQVGCNRRCSCLACFLLVIDPKSLRSHRRSQYSYLWPFDPVQPISVRLGISWGTCREDLGQTEDEASQGKIHAVELELSLQCKCDHRLICLLFSLTVRIWVKFNANTIFISHPLAIFQHVLLYCKTMRVFMEFWWSRLCMAHGCAMLCIYHHLSTMCLSSATILPGSW